MDNTDRVTLTDKLKVTERKCIVTKSTDQCDEVGWGVTVPLRLVS